MNDATRPEMPARVVESFGRRVVVDSSGERLPAELFGKRLSCVCGDDVTIRLPSPGGDTARVIAIAPRRSLFARTDSRGRTEPLASNLSLLVVIVAPEPEPDLYIADRYLAGAAMAGVAGAIVVNKCDLASADAEGFRGLMSDYEAAGYPVVNVSALLPATIEPLRSLLA